MPGSYSCRPSPDLIVNVRESPNVSFTPRVAKLDGRVKSLLNIRDVRSRSVDYGEVERALCRIPEVSAARIVIDDTQQPVEVHILASPEKHAKQLVRDIQSVAMVSFGLDIDRRVISVVQLEGVNDLRNKHEPTGTESDGRSDDGDDHRATNQQQHGNGAVGTDPRPSSVDDPSSTSLGRVIVDHVRTLGTRMECTAEVTLRRDGDLASGAATGLQTTGNSIRLIAQATMFALQTFEPAACRAQVESATIITLSERRVALAVVTLLDPPHEEILTGSATVRAAGDLDATARAVLDAVNRRLLERQHPASP